MDRGAWWDTPELDTTEWVILSTFTFTPYMGWVISQANEWKDYSKYFGKGVELSRNWATAHSLVFASPGTLLAPAGVLFSLLCVQFSSVQSLSHLLLFATPWTAALQADVLQWAYTEAWGLVVVDSSAILDPFGSNELMSCPQARPFFLRLCPVPFPPISLLVLKPRSHFLAADQSGTACSWLPEAVCVLCHMPLCLQVLLILLIL